jgi:glycerol-3-phosphate cytidylyltransferase-like family protein
MDEKERLLIISELKLVDKVYLSEDKDRTVNKSLQKVYVELGSKYKLFFANGGDQNNDLIPEKDTCYNLGIDLIDSLGNKIQSSSWLLKK